MNKTRKATVKGNKIMRNHILAMAFFLSAYMTSTDSQGANTGIDVASNYSPSSWTNGATGGTGFQAWNLYISGTGGHYVSTTTQGFGDILTSGSVFGMWGNPAGGNYSNAERLFAGGALSNEQAFQIDLAIAFRNGNKGITLFKDGGFAEANEIWNFNVAGDKYTAGGVEQTAWQYSQTSIFRLTAIQNGADLGISLTRGSDSYTSTIANAALSGFRLYVGSTEAGNDLNNLQFNSLQIIPEPSTPLLMGLGLAGLFALRRIRNP